MGVIIINCVVLMVIYFIYKYIAKKTLSSMFIKIDTLRLYAFIIAPILLMLVNLMLRYFYLLGFIHLLYTFTPILVPVSIILKEEVERNIKKKYYLKYQKKFKSLIIKVLHKRDILITSNDIAISFKRYKIRIKVVIYIKIFIDEFDYFELQSSIESELKREFNNIDFKVLFR